jgi:hypothetical protein
MYSFEYIALRVLHISFTAGWFGMLLVMAGGLSEALKSDVVVLRASAAQAHKRVALSLVFGALTLLTGLVLIFRMGGFKAISPNFHMALGLVVLMLLFSLVFVWPAGKRLKALAFDPQLSLPSEAGTKLKKRLAIGSGILQLLWVVVLVLMYHIIPRG